MLVESRPIAAHQNAKGRLLSADGAAAYGRVQDSDPFGAGGACYPTEGIGIGCAEVDIDRARGRATEDATLASGDFFDVCGPGERGE